MNVANITDANMDSRIGFNLGVRGEYNITNNVFLNGALQFTQKGAKFDENGYKVDFTPGYLEIPVHIGYRFDLGNNVYIFGETGPYFAYGICGKAKIEQNGVEVESDYFGDEGGGKRFDLGWGIRAGVEASGFQVHIGYEYGFTKVADNTDSHNSNLVVGVSYFF